MTESEKLTEADLPNMVAYLLSGATWFKPGDKLMASISADFTRLLAERTAELRKQRDRLQDELSAERAQLAAVRADAAVAHKALDAAQAKLSRAELERGAARAERDNLLSWRDAFDEKARECQSLQTNLFAARAELAKIKADGPRYAKPEGPCMFLGRYECNGSVDLYWRYNSGLPQVGWRRQDSISWYFLNNSGAAIAEAWRRARELGLPCESVAQPLTESEIEASYLATLTAAMIAADVDSVTIRPDDSGVIHRDGLLAAAYDDDSASIFGSPLAALRALVKRDQSSGPDAASS
jgi:hypothetical protein